MKKTNSIIQIIKNLFLCGILISLPSIVDCQYRLLNPSSTIYQLNNEISTYVCPTFDIDAMKAEDLENLSLGKSPMRFAKKWDVSLTTLNSGQWEAVDGLNIWRLKIKSTEAKSMMLIFDQLQLIENSSLFIYSEDMSFILGPYKSLHNTYNVLATPLLPGGSIIVELVYEIEELVKIPFISIKSISHDYYGLFGNLIFGKKDGFAGTILGCHNDINCAAGANWQIEKHAVARIVINGNGLCSGSLVNDMPMDRIPYFLTANHCISTNNDANSSVFYFNYERNPCGSNLDGQTYQIVSGATLRANNGNSDFSLLELNARVPTSYEPFHAGWDRSGLNQANGIVIHHPVGNVKKISFDNDIVTPNPVTRDLGGGLIFLPNTCWDVDYENGTTEGGSSGSPLFNPNGRVVGQLGGGDVGCVEIDDHYGRFSVSWNAGNNNTNRLRDWLDPNNNSPNVIVGLAPQGFLHAHVIGWNAPNDQNIQSTIKAISVGLGNQVFYRGTDNKAHTFYWSNNTWNHQWLKGWNAPSNENIGGDIVVGAGNQVFYRGSDSKMHTYYWANNIWNHQWLTGWNGPSNEHVSSVEGSIAIDQITNQLFYRGTDNKMHRYFWSNGIWNHQWLKGSNAPPNEDVARDVVCSNNNQVFYRGTDSKMHVYYLANNIWNHAWLTGWNGPSNEHVHSAAGSIANDPISGQLFYRGTDNKMHRYFWANGIWNHQWLNGSNAPPNENVAGDIDYDGVSRVLYTGTDGRMHNYILNNNIWAHNWLEESVQAPAFHNVSGSLDAGTNNQIFYRGTDEKGRIYYWANAFTRSSENSYNYSIHETASSPTIPKTFKDDLNYFEVYPNPITSDINIDLFMNKGAVVKVIIQNTVGNILSSETFSTKTGLNSVSIESSKLQTGMYFISIIDSSNKPISKSIVKF